MTYIDSEMKNVWTSRNYFESFFLIQMQLQMESEIWIPICFAIKLTYLNSFAEKSVTISRK